MTIIASSFTSTAQNIKFTVPSLGDTTIYMAKYFGKQLRYADTAQVNNGVFEFDGDKHPTGVYAIILPGTKIVQFIIDNEKIDMILNDQDDIVGSMVVKKSKNNRIFYDYIKYMSENRAVSDSIVKIYKIEENEKKKESLKEELTDLNKSLVDYQRAIFKDYSDMYIGKMMGMSIDIELPEAPKNENGVVLDSSFLYNYNMAHFWDNVNLKNEDLIRTPSFHSRLEKYYSRQVMLQTPDSIISYTENLINRTEDGSMLFYYIVHFVTNKYERSEIMGMDKVFVFMADTYYCPKGKTRAFWMSDEGLTKVCERADELRPILIGTLAPRLILPDTTEKNWIDIYKIEADYKVLYFWDPNCGHCKKVTPKLQQLYVKKFKERNIEIIGIGKATGDDFEAWKDYIADNGLEFINIGLTKNIYNLAQQDARQLIPRYTNIESLNYTSTYDIYSTPRIFILDKDNKILFKQLTIAQLEEILDHLQGLDDVEKLYPATEDGNNDDGSTH